MSNDPHATAGQRRARSAITRFLTWGVASVVLGLLGLVGALTDALMVLTVLLALAAIVCGALGWSSARRQHSGGRRDVAVIGAALGVLTLLTATLMGTSGSETGEAGTDSATEPAQLGDTVRVGNVDVTVTDVSSAPEDMREPSGPESGTYRIVTYELTNPGGTDQVFDKTAQTVYAEGEQYRASTQGTHQLADSATMLESLEPGATIDVRIAFALPEATSVTKVGLVDTDGTEWAVTAP
ncbi:DUF4352 domain-containing protein [Haloechinothrix sp. YIM 98757]|uniref:DUF4352 domain-containing protein n=1 Tax=Haloechinothrix aidingensis TaxID=2752311 RepID=A0A838A898_9PSEU|nr:DUF4352 domain-containing protein [Haloechinothrix aidingensis]MBA0125548.1 DUF4352 domain-containing protein [Haloechinothrix aidingensis]